MQTIKLSDDNAKKIYPTASTDIKQILEDSFGKDFFIPKKITDRVKTFQDACDVLGIKPDNKVSVTIDGAMTQDSKSIQAYCKLIIIARALNEGWVPDWKNSNQYKYYPWFDMSSGSGLSFDGCDFLGSLSLVGSRLCFKSRELAIYAANQFNDIYKDFFII